MVVCAVEHSGERAEGEVEVSGERAECKVEVGGGAVKRDDGCVESHGDRGNGHRGNHVCTWRQEGTRLIFFAVLWLGMWMSSVLLV